MLTQTQRDFLLPKAYNAAVRAGAAILDVYTQEGSLDIDIKKDKTPITIADMRAHETIKSCLAHTHIPVLSEEGREMDYLERKAWDLFWLVDPLDGTKEFIKGNGEFTVNIALMLDNKPVISVIYVPYISKIFFADKLIGSFRKDNVAANVDAEYTLREILDGLRILPIVAGPCDPIRMAVSRSHKNSDTEPYLDKVRARFPDAITIEQGSSYKLCLLAEGTVDYYVRTSDTYEWDTAAGELILESVGGKIVSVDGKPLEYNKQSLVNPWFVCTSKFMPEI